MGLVTGSVGKGTCHASLETWIPSQDPNSGKKELILASSDLCNHTFLIIKCNKNFKINRNEGLVHPDIYEAWKHCKGKSRHKGSMVYESIHANCLGDPPVTERAAAARAAAARETMRSNCFTAWSFIGAMKTLELDKNWPYMCVYSPLTVIWLMSC